MDTYLVSNCDTPTCRCHFPIIGEPRDNTYFDAEEVCKNLYHSDEDSEDDEDDDSSPFERLARKMEDICPNKDGGILKQLLKHGSGPVVPPGSLVRIHFNGYLEYADEPFDSSR
jgi:FK506-binding protein 6